MAFGVLSLWCLAITAITSLPFMYDAIGAERWHRGQRSGTMGENSKESVRVVGICGSLIRGGATQKVVSTVLGGASELGVTAELIDLRDCELVFCGQVAEGLNPASCARAQRFLLCSKGAARSSRSPAPA